MKKLLSGCLLLLCLTVGNGLRAEATNDFTRTEDVIYGRKFGTALTMDVFTPKQPNGYGIVYVVSGGWFSAHEVVNVELARPLLEHGYTVFEVVHGSQPKFQIPEITQDMNRAVRFIRFNAKKYGINPERIGVTGGSAGGHLSLMLATLGGPGAKDAKDPIDRESSAVQCVAAFFPPTDFLNYGKPGESALGENILGNFKAAFGEIPKDKDAKEKFGRSLSPIYHVTSNTPPTLLLHGNADTLVPIQQSETFLKKAEGLGVKTKLVVKEKAGHGWANWTGDIAMFADWFDAELRGVKKE